MFSPNPLIVASNHPPFLVGYAQNGIQNGGTIVSPQFVNVGTTGNLPLESLVPTGDNLSDNVFIQQLDAFGRTVIEYGWVDWAGDNGDQEAWIDTDTFEIASDVTFAPGQGLWVMGSSTSQGIQAAGKVGTDDVSVTLCNGGITTGNPYPVALDLQDIVPEGDNLSDNVFIQQLDAFGRTVIEYGWVDWAGDNGDQEAWIDTDTFEIAEDVSFGPGTGLWVMGSSSAQSIRFPAPEL